MSHRIIGGSSTRRHRRQLLNAFDFKLVGGVQRPIGEHEIARPEPRALRRCGSAGRSRLYPSLPARSRRKSPGTHPEDV